MSETAITVRAQFGDESSAQTFLDTLNTATEAHGHELTAALVALAPGVTDGLGQEINIERVERQSSTVVVTAYAGRIDSPVWLGKSMGQLGAQTTVVSESGDSGGVHHYFVGAKKVSKKVFDVSTRPGPAKPLPPSSELFSPDGRVRVKATLLSHEWKDSVFERFCVMRMQAEDGRHFLYKGTAGLTEMTADDHEKTCEFSAVFEMGEYGGETVSFAKRPTKIQLGSISPVNARKSKLTGTNQAFMEGPFGPIVSCYLEELGGKPDAFIPQLRATSMLGVELTELFLRLKDIDAYSFSGFGLHMSLYNGQRETIQLYTVGDVAIDLEAARQHMDSLDLVPIYKDDLPNAYNLYWAVAGIGVRFKVWRQGFEYFLNRAGAPDAKIEYADLFK